MDADSFNLYLVQTEGELTKYSPDSDKYYIYFYIFLTNDKRAFFNLLILYRDTVQAIGSGTTLAAHCAKVKNF